MKLGELSDLFDKAILLASEDERQTFVDSSCPDPLDREKLNRLIRAHQKSCAILDEADSVSAISKSLTPKRTTPGAGAVIGNYKLLQAIGEGGMGQVFMAAQLKPIQRRVAVKIIKAEMNSRHILARFDAEREALARLDHPNITRIIDAGITDCGLPFFAMELVRGESFSEYVVRNKLPIKERIQLLERVCLAVHHAHQKGIIHRDIKPTNIMITMHDGTPVPKVIDFGIAKALDQPLTQKTLFTRYGDMVGTPQYMSPEQAEQSGLDIDLRSDVYSLGVVLYELLTGSTPIEAESLEGKGILGVLEMVRDSDTESPSIRATKTMALENATTANHDRDAKHLTRLLRGELDWITMKAIAKDRNERYESAGAMARDLQSYLNGEPVSAVAPTFRYHARKMYQRHRSICLTLAVAALLLIVTSLVSLNWAISNGKLKSLAFQRTAELREKTEQLERLNSELSLARDQARDAEREALKLATEKKKQAAYERAISRMLMDQVKGAFQMTAEGAPVTSSNLGRELKAILQSVDSANNALIAGIRKKRTITIPSTEFFIGPPSISLRGTSPDMPEHVKLAIGGLLPGLEGGASKHQIEFLEVLTSEYRKEFGNKHWIVAEALLSSCNALLEFEPINWAKIESRTREAKSILDPNLHLDLDTGCFLRLQASCVLVCALDGQGRSQEATSLKNASKQEIDRDESPLTEVQRKTLLSLLNRQ